MVYESRVGDVILLGATSWRIVDITADRVLVLPAYGQPGKLPFWRGDAAGRPAELGDAVGRFRRELDADPEAGRTRLLLPRAVGLIAPLRALPAPVFDRAMDVLGVNATMDGFTGRRSRLFAGRETAR